MSTGRLIIGVLVTLLTAAGTRAQPSTDLASYVLFADSEIRASGTTISDGDLGVNSGRIISGPPLDAPDSVVAADTVDIDGGSTCEALFSNNVEETGPGCGPAAPLASPILDLAAACGVAGGFPACGTDPVTVDKHGSRTLTPGTYGDVAVKNDGVLVLEAGDYVFCQLRLSRKASLQANGPVNVKIAGRLSFSNGANVGPAPGVEISACDVQFVVGGDGTIDRQSLVRASVCAPDGRLRLRNGADLVGTFAADRIRSGRLVADACSAAPSTTTTSTVSTTTTTIATGCGNGTIEAGEDCDPPGSSCTGAFTGICQGDCTCPGPTTTSTTVSTTTTTIADNCGNGTIDAGEDCDPPGSSCAGAFTGICQGDCTCPGPSTTTTSTTEPPTTSTTEPPATTSTTEPTVTTTTTSTSTTLEPCGNGTIDAGEDCDPPGSSCTGAFTGICQGDCTCPGATTTSTIVSETTTTTVAETTTTTIVGETTTTTVAETTTTTLEETTTTTTSSTTTTLEETTTTTTSSTTTTLEVTTTTTSSTTTTTVVEACCGVDPTRLSFTTAIGSGNCGTVQLSNGTVSKNLACSGLYTGGGGNTVPLPYNVPDMGTSLTGVSSCVSETNTLTLTNLSSAETGSNRNCTSIGCLFGPPLPIPNAGSTPTSVCVINVVAEDASGTANCVSGVTQLSLPLSSVLHLSGDLFPTAPGIQVCPVCNLTCNAGTNLGGPCNVDADCPGGAAGSCAGASVCHGGENDGDPCTAGSSPNLGTTNSFPTSQDCPPLNAHNIGALPIAFNLTTGSTSVTAVNNPASGQNNVFCGYCRDINGLGTGCFAGDPNPICPTPNPADPVACTNNAGCPAEYPDCIQRTAGAFGPAGGGAKTITETGSPAGDMTDGAPHASTLASIFCIQPTFNSTVDAAGDLPGPGAVTLQGQAQLLP